MTFDADRKPTIGWIAVAAILALLLLLLLQAHVGAQASVESKQGTAATSSPSPSVRQLEKRIEELEAEKETLAYTVGRLQGELGSALAQLAEARRAASQATLQARREALVERWRIEDKAPKDAVLDETTLTFKPSTKKSGGEERK